MKLRLTDIASWVGGRLIGSGAVIEHVSTDTRTLKPASLFVALNGERYDAHDFVAIARERGAGAAMVERELDVDIAQIVVDDTLIALGELARAVRSQREARVVGVTGSNGKTTVKTLTAAILARHGATHVNAGNYNNEIGLPLTLLAMPSYARYAVLEMGAGKPGDIAYLARIARPDVALVNNVAPAHLERLGSLDGVAETKGAILSALPADGIAVVNADDAYAGYFEGLAGARRIVRFGLEHPADVHGEVDAEGRLLIVTPAGETRAALALPGRHNVMNALAAAAIAIALEVPPSTIGAGLIEAPSVAGRLVRRTHPSGAIVIDDSYNANPGSFAAAIATLAAERGETILVMGDMAELGEEAERLHAEVGGLAKRSGIARVLAVGRLSAAAAEAFGAGASHFDDQPALIEALRGELRDGVVALVKGSRSSAMDRVVAALLDDGNGGERHAA